MILYFDSYITDIPLKGGGRSRLKEDIRKKCSAYRMPKKIDIAKYTLASYAHVPWSHVLIRYELEDHLLIKEFDNYIKSLFPKAQILHTRSDSQNDYKKSLKLLEEIPDEWVFYAPNNDHPLVSSDSHVALYIEKLLQKAEIWKKKYQYVSVMYSHISEFLNIPNKGTPEHFLLGRDTTILDDDNLALVYCAKNGDFSSVQIVHKDHFRQWFSSADLRNKRIIRAEDVAQSVSIENQVVIVPKKELCAHFDGYEHMMRQPNEILIDSIPPLFIPTGFFEKNIKIAYGYNEYREEWVNINPCAKKYSFRDKKNGTDLKIALENIPFFWRERIKTIDINKKIDVNKLKECGKKWNNIQHNPWTIKNQGLTIKSVNFWIRYYLFKIYIFARMSAAKLMLTV